MKEDRYSENVERKIPLKQVWRKKENWEQKLGFLVLTMMKTKLINGLKCYNYNTGWKVDKESDELLKDKSEMLMTNEVHIAKRLNESFASVCMKEFEGHIP